ncbi:MAG TPA: transglutaminase domain-containing protein [Candidatus Limnocylindrales bacterium]
MTAVAAATQARSPFDALRRLPRRPAEGWLTVFATMAMVAVFGWSLIDADWTPGRAGDSNFLPWVGMVGLAFGIGGAKVGWGRWRTHVVGALFAGIFIPLIVGGIILGPDTGWDLASLGARFMASGNVARAVYNDWVVLNLPFTSQTAHYHLIFGALLWGAGMLAGFTVFGHHRPLDAVVVLGLAIIANMALTQHDQLYLIVIFTAAALLVLIRTHVFEEEVTWTRRKIGDPTTVGQLYIQGGALFVVGAIVGSILLTWTASSAPLQGVWQDLPHSLQALSQALQKFAPAGGDIRGLGVVGFGDNVTTSGLWEPSDNVAFRAQLLTGPDDTFKWRAGTYATYTNYGWKWGDTRAEPTAARSVLLGGDVSADAPSTTASREVTFRIMPASFRDQTVLGPKTLYSVDRPTNALVVGAGYFTTVESTDAVGTYDVTARIPTFADVTGGITEQRLRLAGTDYPAGMMALYGPTSLPVGAMGPHATDLLNTIRANVKAPSFADPGNPYDLARTMEAYLRSSDHFTYDTNVVNERNAQCGSVSTVECFAIIKRGYCEYYASTMAVLMRASGVPARVAYGFLPTTPAADGVETVQAKQAHWWVEVYFPGTGWVEFDPTGEVGSPLAIPSGAIPSATPKTSKAPGTAGPAFSFPAGEGGGSTTTTSNGVGPFIAIALILVVGFAALAFAALRRTPNKPMHPDKAWGSLASLAARFGLGPKPSQTVYEYAGALGDAVPGARVELTTIARAKVEVAYGQRDLGVDRLKRIAEAYQRLRFAILGVVVRRVLRRRAKR